jgi:hypothetical protein
VHEACPKTGKRRPPDPKSLEPLFAVLNSIAEIFKARAEEWRSLEEKRLEQGLPVWASSVDLMLEYFKGRRDVAAESGNRVLIETEERRLADAERTAVALCQRPPWWRTGGEVGWHEVAEVIAAAFKTVLLNTNAVVGNPQTGPVARFVAAVIPYITGEDDPGPKAVGEHLTRCARKRKGPV